MQNRSNLLITGLIGIAAFGAACGSAANTSSNTAVKPDASNVKPADSASNTSAVANTATPSAKPFSKTVEMHGIKFLIESPNKPTGNTVTIKPSGLTASNEEVRRDIKGTVTEAEVGDLNIDQSPEVYVYVTKSGPENGTELIAYASNSKKSMSEAYLAPPDLSSPDFKGYKGENEFAIVESTLIQRFPIFDGDKKTEKMRQIQYKLKPGEATWQLVKEKVTEL